MSRATRGRRAGRVAGVGAALAGAAVAVWGVPIDPTRVAGVMGRNPAIHVRAAGARVALRPFPTIVATDVRLAVEDRVRATLTSVSIALAVGPLVGGEATWSRARLRGGRLALRAAAGDVPIRCAGIAGRVVAAGADRTRLDLSGDCASVGVTLGAVRFRGGVDWTRRTGVRAAGRVTSEGPMVAGVAGEGLVATVRTGADGLRADDVRLTIGGGTVLGRGRWLRDGTRHRVAVAFEGTGGAAEDAFGAAALRIDGRWVVRGRGRAVAPIGAPLGRSVSGHGRLALLDGSIEPLDVGGALLDGLEVWRGGRRRRLRERFPDVFGGPRLRYDRAVVGARARRGRYDFAPLRVRSRSYGAEGHCRLGRDGLVRGEVRVVPSEALADALLGRGALRAIVTGERDEMTLPIEVVGRPGALKVRPAPAFAREVLERALGGSTLGRTLDRLLTR